MQAPNFPGCRLNSLQLVNESGLDFNGPFACVVLRIRILRPLPKGYVKHLDALIAKVERGPHPSHVTLEVSPDLSSLPEIHGRAYQQDSSNEPHQTAVAGSKGG